MNNELKNQTPNVLVDHLFRHEYGKMVSVLLKLFGPAHLNMVEDVVQEAFIKAIGTWRHGKIPENPSAWLHKVARNRAIDILRSNKARDTRNIVYFGGQPSHEAIAGLFVDEEIADAQLRLIFTCCNLNVSDTDKIALTLKVLSGFGIKEIAKALMMKEDSIKKRLHRARQKLRQESKDLILPTSSNLMDAMHLVHTILYLMFNEGYYSSSQDKLVRKDLCAEAMRLCRLITDHSSCKNSESYALMALMCYQASRLDARVGQDQEIILLSNQDRSKWYRPLIQIGHSFYSKSRQTDKYSVYHLEAAIAAQHCESISIETTDWTTLIKLYRLLNEVKPSPIVKLNLAVALTQNKDAKKALELMDTLTPTDFDPNPYLFHAVISSVYDANNFKLKAIHHLNLAIDLAVNESEKRLLSSRLTVMKESF